MNRQKDDAWGEAKRLCGLNHEDVRMARELGFQPKSLIKNIPNPSQKWKAPVNQWVRSLYEKKFGSRQQIAIPSSVPAAVPLDPEPPKSPSATGFRNPDFPWPDRPEIPAPHDYEPEDVSEEDDEDEEDDDGGWGDEFAFNSRRFEPPSDEDIDEQNGVLLRRQCLFRWAEQCIAVAMSDVPEVRRVAAFGAVAQPLELEVPRFREYRRHGIEVLHECADLDLAVWLTGVGKLQELRRALQRGLSVVQDTRFGGVAGHQVDVHILDDGTNRYRGRLCFFSQCPKPRKRECLVPDCGASPFLRQFERYHFQAQRFEAAPKVILYDRPSGYLVHLPRIELAGGLVLTPIEDDHDAPF